MSSAYGYAIQPMSSGAVTTEKAFRTVFLKAERRPHWRRELADAGVMRWSPYCSGRDCDQEPTFASQYFYVTGRRGRVTDRVQYWCQACAEKWAKKHGLTIHAKSLDQPLTQQAGGRTDGAAAVTAERRAGCAESPADSRDFS